MALAPNEAGQSAVTFSPAPETIGQPAIVARPISAAEQDRLYNNAVSLVARSGERDLALIGRVSDAWMNSEAERSISVASLRGDGANSFLGPRLDHQDIYQPVSEQDYKKYIAGKETQLQYPRRTSDEGDGYLLHIKDLPEQTLVADRTGALKERDRMINSNVIPKLSAEIRQPLVAGNLLLSGNLDINGSLLPAGQRPHDLNLVTAAIISNSYGKKDDYSALNAGQARGVDDAYILEKFNPEVLDHVHGIRAAEQSFDAAVAGGQDVRQLGIPEAYQNVIAAKALPKLQESSKAAAYGLLSTTSSAQQQELAQKGLTPGAFRETETGLVRSDLARAKAALSLPGLAEGTAAPLRDRLVPSVERALAENTDAAWHRQAGIGGESFQAVRESMNIHNFAVEGPEGFNNTLYSRAAGLNELANYFADTRRKGNTSNLQHSLLTGDYISQAFDGNARAVVMLATDQHDIVEDGGLKVSGKDESLARLGQRLGPTVQQMIADVTDDEKLGHAAGYAKAATTATVAASLDQSTIYEDLGGVTRAPLPTNAARAYSLETQGVKIADFDATMTENIREPQANMGSYGTGSGMRIGLAVVNKGFVENTIPLTGLKIVQDFDQHIAGLQTPEEKVAYINETLPNGKARGDLVQGIRNVQASHIEVSDQYAVQNLKILGDEFGLTKPQTTELTRDFHSLPVEDFQAKYLIGDKALLGAANFQPQAGIAPDAKFSAVFDPKAQHRYAGLAEPLSAAEIKANPNAYTLLAYKLQADERQTRRAQIGLPELDLNAPQLTDVTDRYDAKMVAQKPAPDLQIAAKVNSEVAPLPALSGTPATAGGVPAASAADYIRDMAAKNPGIVEHFGGQEAFDSTVRSIERLDTTFKAGIGEFFHLGATPAETQDSFNRIHNEQYREGARPSLPALVAHQLDGIGLDPQNVHYQAAVLAAARTEVLGVNVPEYHNNNHFADVTAQQAEFLKRNNLLAEQGVAGAVKLTPEQLADGITAAAIHDLGHPGGKNALPGEKLAEDSMRLERQATALIKPLLEQVGLPQDSINQIDVAVLTTSPDMNGPGKLLKAVDQAHKAGEAIDFAVLPDHEKFQELNRLGSDPVTRVFSSNLRAADLGQSALNGLESNLIATKNLQAEWSNPARGYADQISGDKARKGFLDFAAFGEKGPDAAGARDAVGANYDALYHDTKVKVEALKAQEAAKVLVMSTPAPVNAATAAPLTNGNLALDPAPVAEPAAAPRTTPVVHIDTGLPEVAVGTPAPALRTAFNESGLTAKPEFNLSKRGSMPDFESSVIAVEEVAGRRVGGGLAAVGLVQGGLGLKEAIRAHDAGGIAADSANIGANLTQIAETGLRAAGKADAAESLAPWAGKLGAAAMVVADVVEVAKTKGPVFEHDKDGQIRLGAKGDKIVETTAGTAIGSLGLLATGGGALAGGAIVTALAPVVVTGATVYKTQEAVRTGLAAQHAATDLEHDLHDHTGANAAISLAGRHAGEQPQIGQYPHLSTVAADPSLGIVWKNMNGDHYSGREAIQMESRTRPDGRAYTQANLSDPQTHEAIQQSLDRQIAQQEAVVKANSSKVNDVARGAAESAVNTILFSNEDSAKIKTSPELKWEAEAKLQQLLPARQELDKYKLDMQAYAAPTQPTGPAIVHARGTSVDVTANLAPLETQSQPISTLLTDTPTERQPEIGQGETKSAPLEPAPPPIAAKPQFGSFTAAVSEDNLVGKATGLEMAMHAFDMQVAALMKSMTGAGGGITVASAKPGVDGPVQIAAGGPPLAYLGPDANKNQAFILPPVINPAFGVMRQ